MDVLKKISKWPDGARQVGERLTEHARLTVPANPGLAHCAASHRLARRAATSAAVQGLNVAFEWPVGRPRHT